MTHIEISVQPDTFDVAAEMARLTDGDAGIGAVVAFVGLVRDFSQPRPVRSMTLEHYPGMTQKALQSIAEEAGDRWPLHGIRIIHRVGDLAPTAPIVLVLTTSAHRQAAYAGNEFIMDYLKTRAPFWKKEYDANGEGHWVDARESDTSAAQRWDRFLSEQYGVAEHD